MYVCMYVCMYMYVLAICRPRVHRTLRACAYHNSVKIVKYVNSNCSSPKQARRTEQQLASSPGPLRGGERAWYTLSAHAPLP